MTKTSDDLYLDPNMAQFYDLGSAARDDFTYCSQMAEGAASVLDLGCGTGELAISLAPGRTVSGVEPAQAMLQIARDRTGGAAVTWHLADAKTVRLGQRFDLVVLTGHSFQVFLESEDQHAVLATIQAHLAPGGRFIFDSRNPDFPGRKERNRDEAIAQITHPRLGKIEKWNVSRYDTDSGILSYENGYRVLDTDEEFSATAQIRYTPQRDLAAMITAAGLTVDAWLGDWKGTPYHPTAREIIPIGRLA